MINWKGMEFRLRNWWGGEEGQFHSSGQVPLLGSHCCRSPCSASFTRPPAHWLVSFLGVGTVSFSSQDPKDLALCTWTGCMKTHGENEDMSANSPCTGGGGQLLSIPGVAAWLPSLPPSASSSTQTSFSLGRVPHWLYPRSGLD